jgi:CubicO group peptidase (beta-lactamase class C family)
MKTLHYSLLMLCIILGPSLYAQKQEEDLIKQTIETYFDGWMTGDSTKLGKAMHSTCNLKNIKDNQVLVIDRKNYLSRFKLRPKLENAFGRIIAINITGKIASAKCEIETSERLFTDYFNMMQLNGEWYIVDKISTNKIKSKLNTEMNAYISEIQKQYNIPGLALAIIKNDSIIHENYYGLANIEMSAPVTNKTLFPLFSTTKVMSVIAVHQLIEQNKLSLDQYISDFLDDLPKNWKKIQIKHLLTHSSGLPDIVNYTDDKEAIAKQKVYKDAIKFSIGKKFDYNQTNYWLINRIFQKLTQKTLSTYIIENQFPNTSQSVVYEGNNLNVIENLSYGYVNTANSKQYLKRNWSFPEYEYGAAALNMTLQAFIEWDKKFENGTFISEKTKAQLFTPFNYEEKRDFTYGLDLIHLNGDLSYGFSGGVATAYRKFTNKNLTIILLANGMFIPTDKLKGINEVINTIATMADKK